MPWVRILSALVLAPPILAAVYWGFPAFHGVVVAATAILAWEWTQLCGIRRLLPVVVLTAGAVVAPVLASAGEVGWALAALGAGAAAAAVVAAMAAGGAGGADPEIQGAEGMGRKCTRAAWFAAGTVWIGLPMAALVVLRDNPVDGRWQVLWLLAVVWAVDIGAYISGRLIGGPRLAPRVSPNKTWAGLVGGVLAAGAVGAIGGALVDQPRPELWGLGAMALGVLEQGGDLLESAMKRHFGHKDASQLIPGHGGLMDRVDGLLPAALALWIARMVIS